MPEAMKTPLDLLYAAAPFVAVWRTFVATLGVFILGISGVRAAENPELLSPIESIGEILKKGHEPGYEGRRVHVTGVVTYSEPNWRLTFIQDATGGIYIFGDRQVLTEQGVAPGRLVTVKGRIGRGRMRPIIVGMGSNYLVTEVQAIGSGPLPEPLKLTADKLDSAEVNSQWAEVRGRVKTLRLLDDRASLDLDIDGKSFEVMLPNYTRTDLLPRHLQGLDIEARGVMAATWNAQEKFEKAQLLVPSMAYILVQPRALDALFNAPARTIGSLIAASSEGNRTRLVGVLTAQLPGLGFFLRDATGATWVETQQPTGVAAGRLVDVVGLEIAVAGRSALRDAYVRPVTSNAVVNIQPAQSIDLRHTTPKHGDWMRVGGIVVEVLRGTSESILRLRNRENVFSARVRAGESDSRVLDSWVPGAEIELTGTVVDGDWAVDESIRLPGAWRLLVDAVSDVRLVKPPPWWTHERLMGAAIALGIGAISACVFAFLLRRQVRVQSETIAEQRARVALSEERGRISRELHDSLEQYLTGLSIQLDAVSAKLGGTSSDIKRLVDTAQQMVRHGHADTRAAIWELRARALENAGLVQALEELLPLAASGLPVKVLIQATQAPIQLPGNIEHHLLRIAQEAVTNSIKHAKAKTIEVIVSVVRNDLKLTIRDDGIGFVPGKLDPMVHSGLGLIGMRERAEKIGGRLRVQSEPSCGTCVEVTVALRPESKTDRHSRRGAEMEISE